MTEKTQPTDAEIEALGHRMCWRYKHDTGVNHISTFTFNAQTLHDFARAVLARWGQPAHSGEPVAFIHWPINGPPRLVWYSQKALNDAILKTYEGHQPDVELYTAPQPVEREPLTPERVKEIVLDAGYDQCDIPDSERAAFIDGLRHGEEAHGIKGGQHGTE